MTVLEVTVTDGAGRRTAGVSVPLDGDAYGPWPQALWYRPFGTRSLRRARRCEDTGRYRSIVHGVVDVDVDPQGAGFLLEYWPGEYGWLP